MKKVLITGAAGDVGSHLRRELAGRYALRLSDIRPIKNLAKGEEFIRGDCANLRDMLRVTKGVDAVVHLGGLTPQAIEHQAFDTVAQVAEIVHGRAPKGAVNAQHATRLARLAKTSPRREA